jgi:hypothetical protein
LVLVELVLLEVRKQALVEETQYLAVLHLLVEAVVVVITVVLD